MSKWLLFFLSFSSLYSFHTIGQNATIKGKITDAKTNEPVIGANIIVTEKKGVTSDLDGNFSIEIEPGDYVVKVSYIGYEEKKTKISVKAGESKELTIAISDIAKELDIVVVSGSKYARKYAEETVSIGVLTSNLIQSSNTVTLSETIDKITGVQIMDNQIMIRGGAGFSFGVGSRVLLLMDDVPMLSVDRNEIRWNFIPLEMVEQVEVLKSASSALYGSAALNGVVNARTGWPKEKPETRATLYYNAYAKPKNENAAWWNYSNSKPMRYGGSFAHFHRFTAKEGKHNFGKVDLVTGVNLNKTIGFVRLLDPYHARLTFKLRHIPEKAKGLSYGVSFNFMDSQEADYFFWANADSGAYVPFDSEDDDDKGSLSVSKRVSILIDPWIRYFDKFGNQHLLRARYNYIDVKFSSFPNPYAHQTLVEYQFQRKFDYGRKVKMSTNIITGIEEQQYWLQDPLDLGIRQGTTLSYYAQIDQKIGRLIGFVGGRYEQYWLDEQRTKGRPVFTAGLNFQAAKTTYLRASFGQGFRLPSIAEKFVDNSIGPVHVFPNPDLLPEFGFNSEIGLKQGFKISNWLAYFDFSFFWFEYWDMMEFSFGVHGPDSLPLGERFGFKSKNLTRTRIAGYELSIIGEGKIGKIPISLQAGYTYNYPVDLSADSSLARFDKYMGLFFKSMAEKPEYRAASDCNEITCNMLKYRSRHLFKSDIEFDLWHVILGIDTRYYSFVEGVDPVFELFITDITDFRKENDEGEWLLNLRAGYDFSKFGKVMLIVNNVTNNLYTLRPARMEAPLNFTIQYSVKI